VPGNMLTAKVPDLKERAEYQFRVVAVNKAGPSPASDPTGMHTVKHKACKYLHTFKRYKLINCMYSETKNRQNQLEAYCHQGRKDGKIRCEYSW
jgi:hypothetical protein